MKLEPMKLETLVRDLQRAARAERIQYKRELLLQAANWIWQYACQNEEETIPLPCPDCGSLSTDCGCQ